MFESTLPPRIVDADASLEHGFYFLWGEGPTDSLGAVIDSLVKATWADTLATIGPLDLPTPFDLGNFIDTLATYPTQAEDLGWIDSTTTVADDLQTALDELSEDLAAGDSAHASGLIQRTLALVEAEKDSALTSEAYALFKYNLEYALGYLPDVVAVHVFLEGSYNPTTGSLGADLNSVLPLADTVFADPDLWSYESGKVLSSIPGHAVDWLYVAAIDSADLDSVVYEATGLLDKYGLVYLTADTNLSGSYYVIVDHRNHLPIASNALVDFTAGKAEFDFTTGYALSEQGGPGPQKQVSTGVYAMWAGDGGELNGGTTVDCQVLTDDFNAWLVDTKLGSTGYLATDFDLDVQATTSDFNLWLANTKLGVHCPEWMSAVLFGNTQSGDVWQGGTSAAAAKTEVTDELWVRYHPMGSSENGRATVNLNVRTVGGTEIDTLGSATIDVYYNSDQLYYSHALEYQDLLDAGYSVQIDTASNEYGSYVRVNLYTFRPDTVSYTFDNAYLPHLLRLRFYENNGPITDNGLGANLRTLSVQLLSDGEYTDPGEIVPKWLDAFQY